MQLGPFTHDPANDSNCRYMRPVMRIRDQGRGNGAQFVIENLRDIAQAIKRPPQEIIYFLQQSLGNTGRYSREHGSATFTGRITLQDADKQLQVYINQYVICPMCGIPQTKYIAKDKALYLSCLVQTSHEKQMPDTRFTKHILKDLDERSGPRTRHAGARGRMPYDYYPKIQKIMKQGIPVIDKYAEIKPIVDAAIANKAIQTEEIIFFLIAAIFDKNPPPFGNFDRCMEWISHDFAECVQLLQEFRVEMGEIDGIFVLHAIDCLAKKYEEILGMQDFVSSLLFELYKAEIITWHSVSAWLSLVEPLVPTEFHERVVASAKAFIDWLEQQTENAENEDAEEEYEEEYEEEESA